MSNNVNFGVVYGSGSSINYEAFSEDVVLYIHRKRLTQSDFAKETGLDRSTISRIVRNSGRVDARAIASICRTIGKPFSYYVTGSAELVVSQEDTLFSIEALITSDNNIREDCKRPLFDLIKQAYIEFSRLQNV